MGVISDSVVDETAKWVVGYPRACPIFHVFTQSFCMASGPARIVLGHDADAASLLANYTGGVKCQEGVAVENEAEGLA
jgi:hypothetical protein